MTSLAPKMLHPEQVSGQKVDDKPWLRQRNEPALWYMRFQRYLALGPKRSMRAALSAEPNPRKASGGPVKLSDISVPGSWKRASKQWRWQERCEAYDMHETSMYAQALRETANLLPYSSCAYRIITLNNLAANLEAQIKPKMDTDLYVSVVARLQSIMRDISTETAKLDGVTKDACDAGAALYAEKKFLEQEAREKLRDADLPDALIIAIEAEEARRALLSKQG